MRELNQMAGQTNRGWYAHKIPNYAVEGKTDFDVECGQVAEDLKEHTQIEGFRRFFKRHPQSTIHGFVDLAVFAETKSGCVTGCVFMGMPVRLLKGVPTLDIAQAKSEKDGKYYDTAKFRSAAERAVLTIMVHSDPEISACIQEDFALEAAGEAAGGGESQTPPEERPVQTPVELSEGNPFLESQEASA